MERVSVKQQAAEKRFASVFELLETERGERLVRIAYTTNGAARRGPVTLRARRRAAPRGAARAPGAGGGAGLEQVIDKEDVRAISSCSPISLRRSSDSWSWRRRMAAKRKRTSEEYRKFREESDERVRRLRERLKREEAEEAARREAQNAEKT